MIATVSGSVSAAGSHDVVIDVHGIGLLVSVTGTVARSIRVGDSVSLHTVFIPRDDEWQLFGFTTPEDKAVFQALRGVTGVGPRTALAVIDTLSVSEIAEAVATGNDAVFRSVSGIGSKTASLIVVTLSGKLPRPLGDAVTDLMTALTGLGWGESRAREIAQETVESLPDHSLGERLRHALGVLGRKA